MTTLFCTPSKPTDLSGTGRTGQWLRPIFTGSEDGTDLLLNTTYPVRILVWTDENGDPVVQPGVQIFIRFANDLTFDDVIFETEIPQYDPGDVINERWEGEISKDNINLIPPSGVVYAALYRVSNGVEYVDDAYGFTVVGGV